MGSEGTPNADGTAVVAGTPRAVAIAEAGIRTGEDFSNLMSALMSDVIENRISPSVSNAAVNAGGKLLKVVEMSYKYGQAEPSRPTAFVLAPGGGQA